jgi:hypothetical protein
LPEKRTRGARKKSFRRVYVGDCSVKVGCGPTFIFQLPSDINT